MHEAHRGLVALLRSKADPVRHNVNVCVRECEERLVWPKRQMGVGKPADALKTLCFVTVGTSGVVMIEARSRKT